MFLFRSDQNCLGWGFAYLGWDIQIGLSHIILRFLGGTRGNMEILGHIIARQQNRWPSNTINASSCARSIIYNSSSFTLFCSFRCNARRSFSLFWLISIRCILPSFSLFYIISLNNILPSFSLSSAFSASTEPSPPSLQSALSTSTLASPPSLTSTLSASAVCSLWISSFNP